MKKEYWDVSDEHVIEKTGENIDHWKNAVAHLQNEHNISRYWARTMTTLFLKSA